MAMETSVSEQGQKQVYVLCDFPGCLKRIAFEGVNKKQAIKRARELGWSCSQEFSRCPEHKNGIAVNSRSRR